ncbi:ADP-ribosylglycohydrolase family protein [Tenacibaculum sp. 190524A02b]|uniref:ADP-ribosylglycohydrolase family protein n=1 Tax=Tenacibaculum vairaonense TaxID=3137860 RepID=UPI0031FB521B
MKSNIIEATFLGLAVGDALGVPVEFRSRKELQANPVKDMREYGTHNQPKGTWSDDSSLTFCLAESLCKGYNTNDIAKKFAQWHSATLWNPYGKVFDIGNATNRAIYSLKKGTPATLAGGTSEYDNGNGSLMRISPLAFYIKEYPIERRFDIVKEVSSITHGHIRAIICCFIYIEFIFELLKNSDKENAYKETQLKVNQFLNENPICSNKELNVFHRILKGSIHELEEYQISSSGYVIDTLEASLWCLLTSSSYKETVLKAVNLGDDTDTTATVAGAIAGLYYGMEAIPKEWVEVLARKNDIISLSKKFAKKYGYEKQ